jgi:hypothetical protein
VRGGGVPLEASTGGILIPGGVVIEIAAVELKGFTSTPPWVMGWMPNVSLPVAAVSAMA